MFLLVVFIYHVAKNVKLDKIIYMLVFKKQKRHLEAGVHAYPPTPTPSISSFFLKCLSGRESMDCKQQYPHYLKQ